jgi:hypothetical protein
MKLILGLVVGSLIFTGCGSDNIEANSDSNLSKLKKEACSLWREKDTNTDRYMSYLAAIKFQEIAEQDSSFNELSKSAFILFSLNSTTTFADTIKPLFLESTSEVIRYCSSNNFLGFTPSPEPSPSGS